MSLMVYDESVENFRELNKNNYNDDIVCGTVLLKRGAIEKIKKHFRICGYILISIENGCYYPIDIHKDKIVLFEGVYNNMPKSLKEALIQYNITSLPEKIWSSFFFNWQFLCDMSAFENHGSFIRLCSNIIGIKKRYKPFLNAGISLYEPATYEELCEFTRNIFMISKVDVFSCDYYESIKYLIDSLIKGYHINFTDEEILTYFIQISKLVDEGWEK